MPPIVVRLNDTNSQIKSKTSSIEENERMQRELSQKIKTDSQALKLLEQDLSEKIRIKNELQSNNQKTLSQMQSYLKSIDIPTEGIDKIDSKDGIMHFIQPKLVAITEEFERFKEISNLDSIDKKIKLLESVQEYLKDNEFSINALNDIVDSSDFAKSAPHHTQKGFDLLLSLVEQDKSEYEKFLQFNKDKKNLLNNAVSNKIDKLREIYEIARREETEASEEVNLQAAKMGEFKNEIGANFSKIDELEKEIGEMSKKLETNRKALGEDEQKCKQLKEIHSGLESDIKKLNEEKTKQEELFQQSQALSKRKDITLQKIDNAIGALEAKIPDIKNEDARKASEEILVDLKKHRQSYSEKLENIISEMPKDRDALISEAGEQFIKNCDQAINLRQKRLDGEQLSLFSSFLNTVKSIINPWLKKPFDLEITKTQQIVKNFKETFNQQKETHVEKEQAQEKTQEAPPRPFI
ncbi:hypothetical protein [Legionella cincinnatiensis]|uniref:Uncharacterized protein n=1 Tax=Legionella cincinnatiensis TaxID=28085 RepID=A0A378ILZ7_9GAMM|nr:hypothetical protein [Legionella cincinnatiensis]KTC83435.1 hypothetical protein Lcin_2122 [Legionella cincinnatiensis]STX35521.1 Uncharacterised protein [Legionella cincinnatiensis]